MCDTGQMSKSYLAMYHLHEVYSQAVKRLDVVLQEKTPLTFSQYLLLTKVKYCEKDSSQGDLARELQITEAAVSRHMRSLLKSGFLERGHTEKNRRRTILSLTKKGLSTLIETDTIVEAYIKKFFSPLTVKELTSLTDTLARLKNYLHIA